jgi:hypothetical protein
MVILVNLAAAIMVKNKYNYNELMTNKTVKLLCILIIIINAG